MDINKLYSQLYSCKKKDLVLMNKYFIPHQTGGGSMNKLELVNNLLFNNNYSMTGGGEEKVETAKKVKAAKRRRSLHEQRAAAERIRNEHSKMNWANRAKWKFYNIFRSIPKLVDGQNPDPNTNDHGWKLSNCIIRKNNGVFCIGTLIMYSMNRHGICNITSCPEIMFGLYENAQDGTYRRLMTSDKQITMDYKHLNITSGEPPLFIQGGYTQTYKEMALRNRRTLQRFPEAAKSIYSQTTDTHISKPQLWQLDEPELYATINIFDRGAAAHTTMDPTSTISQKDIINFTVYITQKTTCSLSGFNRNTNRSIQIDKAVAEATEDLHRTIPAYFTYEYKLFYRFCDYYISNT